MNRQPTQQTAQRKPQTIDETRAAYDRMATKHKARAYQDALARCNTCCQVDTIGQVLTRVGEAIRKLTDEDLDHERARFEALFDLLKINELLGGLAEGQMHVDGGINGEDTI